MKHHSELLTEDQLKNHSDYQHQADKFLGQTIESIWVGESLGCVEVETKEGKLRVSGFDYGAGRDAGIFVSSTNPKREHPPTQPSEISADAPAGCLGAACCASSSSLWPIDIDLSKSPIDAAFVDGEALIHLWQSYDPNSYYDMQRKLIEWGLENGTVIIRDYTVVLQSEQSESD